jgi:hypothetical protein
MVTGLINLNLFLVSFIKSGKLFISLFICVNDIVFFRTIDPFEIDLWEKVTLHYYAAHNTVTFYLLQRFHELDVDGNGRLDHAVGMIYFALMYHK